MYRKYTGLFRVGVRVTSNPTDPKTGRQNTEQHTSTPLNTTYKHGSGCAKILSWPACGVRWPLMGYRYAGCTGWTRCACVGISGCELSVCACVLWCVWACVSASDHELSGWWVRVGVWVWVSMCDTHTPHAQIKQNCTHTPRSNKKTSYTPRAQIK